LLEHGTLVICAGGGGIPTMYEAGKQRWLTGIEAVIDKDLASELLARELNADLFVIATDVDGVYLDWGKPEQRKLGKVTIQELKAHPFPAGSMGPKVAAAIQFVEMTGKRAAIGSLQDIERIVAGEAGTNVYP
jgi:carbamate kinase